MVAYGHVAIDNALVPDLVHIFLRPVYPHNFIPSLLYWGTKRLDIYSRCHSTVSNFTPSCLTSRYCTSHHAALQTPIAGFRAQSPNATHIDRHHNPRRRRYRSVRQLTTSLSPSLHLATPPQHPPTPHTLESSSSSPLHTSVPVPQAKRPADLLTLALSLRLWSWVNYLTISSKICLQKRRRYVDLVMRGCIDLALMALLGQSSSSVVRD